MANYLNEIDSDFPEDIKFKLGNIIKISIPSTRTPLFSYDYIILDDSKFSFSNPEICKIEFEHYFRKAKQYSKMKISDLCNYYANDGIIRINDKCPDPLKTLLEKVSNQKLRKDQLPPMGHFHLYSKKECPSGICPLVHFFVGPLSTFYILCYDREHHLIKYLT